MGGRVPRRTQRLDLLSERGKKTRQTEKEVERQHQEMDMPGVRQVPEGSGDQKRKKKNKKTEETGVKSCVVPQRPLRLKVMSR